MTADESNVAAAFSAVGNEHRVAILRTLMNGYRGGETPLSYSELMTRVGVRDSGKFNYHLQKLVGRFVAERDGGYALTYAGRTVVAAVASGTLDQSATFDPEPIEGTCYACGEDDLLLRYPDDRVRVTCGACREEVVHILFPPAGVGEKTLDELTAHFDRWARSWRSLASSGTCPECSGRMTGRLGRESGTPATGNVEVRAVLSCERCWAKGYMPPGVAVLDHPAVVSFFWDRGVDVRNRPVWCHEWALSDEYLEVVSTDPLSVAVTAPHGDDALRVEMDESLDVVSTAERRSFETG